LSYLKITLKAHSIIQLSRMQQITYIKLFLFTVITIVNGGSLLVHEDVSVTGQNGNINGGMNFFRKIVLQEAPGIQHEQQDSYTVVSNISSPFSVEGNTWQGNKNFNFMTEASSYKNSIHGDKGEYYYEEEENEELLSSATDITTSRSKNDEKVAISCLRQKSQRYRIKAQRISSSGRNQNYDNLPSSWQSNYHNDLSPSTSSTRSGTIKTAMSTKHGSIQFMSNSII